MNKLILSGRLTQDPEMKQTPNNVEMATFSVAVNRRRDRETVDFFKCICFGQAAKYVTQYGVKGMSLELEGECQINKYQDRNGNNQTAVNVVVDNLAFTSKNSQQQGGNVQQNAPQQNAPQQQAPQASSTPQGSGNYQQRQQAPAPNYRNSAPIYQQACNPPQNGNAPQNGNYPQPPQYRKNQQQFMQVPEGVDDYPFN